MYVVSPPGSLFYLLGEGGEDREGWVGKGDEGRVMSADHKRVGYDADVRSAARGPRDD